jgi:hypothetical protein
MKILIIALGLSWAYIAQSAELVHQFNSPSFSGQGFSNHALTIYQLEQQARDRNQASEDALRARAAAAAANTPQARFIANLESRVYSQLAKQLTDSMFGEGATCTTPGVICGTIENLGGNTINWQLGDGANSGNIVITIQDLNNAGNTTTMTVPVGTFYF